jgi:peptidoglycan/LPS O-acetylase OafA/YrhL
VHFSAITLLAVLLSHFRAIPMNDAVFMAGAAFGVTAGIAFDKWVDQPIQRLLRRRLKPALFGIRQQTQFQLPDVAIETVRASPASSEN